MDVFPGKGGCILPGLVHHEQLHRAGDSPEIPGLAARLGAGGLWICLQTGMSDPYAAVWCELTATLQSFPEAEFTADTAVKREPAETEFTVVKGEPAQQKVKQEPAPAKRAIQMQSSEVAPHKRVKQELELSAHSPPSTPRQKRRCSRSRRRRSNGLSPGQADETIPRHRSYRVRTCRP